MAWWTASETLEVLAALWPYATAWTLITAVAGARSIRRGCSLRRLVRFLLPFAFAAVLFAIGMFLNNPTGERTVTSDIARLAILATFVAQILVSIRLLQRAASAKLFAALAVFGAFALSILGGFVSLMSVTGDWL